MSLRLRFLALPLALLIGLGAPAFAATTKDAPKPAADEKVDTKTVTGQITGMTKRTLSVEYEQTAEGSYEMLLPFDGTVKLERLKTLQQLSRGDTVAVRYEQTYRVNEKGERVILKTVAKQVSLVRTAPKQGLASGGAAAP